MIQPILKDISLNIDGRNTRLTTIYEPPNKPNPLLFKAA